MAKSNLAAILELSSILKMTTRIDDEEVPWIKSMTTEDVDGVKRTTIVMEIPGSEGDQWMKANARIGVDEFVTPSQWRTKMGFK